MAESVGSIGPQNPRLGRLVYRLALSYHRKKYARAGLHTADSEVGVSVIDRLQQRVAAGETCYVAGLGVSGHNSGASLIECSAARGIVLISNDEEERFTGTKHFADYPAEAIEELARRLAARGVDPRDVAAWALSWDYAHMGSLGYRVFAEQFPASRALRKPGATPKWDFWKRGGVARRARPRLAERFGLAPDFPFVMMPHHENHASFSFAASPFNRSTDPVMISVIDGWGDTGSISNFVGQNGQIRLIDCNGSLADSLGSFYSILSSTQGGWTTLSSEGRYMGAVAWGDMDRLTNPYYRRLRQIFHFADRGRLFVNRDLANWHNGGELAPYTKALEEIVGPPIPPEKMWNPDAVLNVNQVQHSEITRARVDLAAATQLVFEDAIFHIVEHLIRSTGSDKLVMTGGTALNALANMKLLERFDRTWYERNLGKSTHLHLWIPPTPGDAGVTIGAAYSLALRAGVPVGPTLQHAAYCGIAPTSDDIRAAIAADPEIGSLPLGSIATPAGLERVADFMAHAISQDAVLGLFQGPAETGPRALGQRSILANPCNPGTLENINLRVKFREPIRPLAPMVTPESADHFFELSPGAMADRGNAYRYMVMTTRARPAAHQQVPAVVHRDGTCRIQIVEQAASPLVYAYLKAMGRRLGAEVSVNTSLNVGGPIAQTPAHALGAMKRAKALSGLILIGSGGEAVLTWHAVEDGPKDSGRSLLNLWQTVSPTTH
jgi:carbamoyltransferase